MNDNKLEKIIKKLFYKYDEKYTDKKYNNEQSYYEGWNRVISLDPNIAYKKLVFALKDSKLFNKKVEAILFSYIFGQNNVV